MKRRELLGVIGGAAAWPLGVWAQQPKNVPRIGFLVTASIESPEARAALKAFDQGLREFGYIDGQNVFVEVRAADLKLERFPALASELVRLNVDLIVASNTPAARAVQQATTTIPIVVPVMGDPIGDGLVASLARPGGNITGMTSITADLSAKRLEILRTLDPTITRFAILWDSSNPGMAARVRETEVAADQSHVLLHTVGPTNLDELEAAFAELLNQRLDALLVTTEAFTRQHLARILDFANRNKIPAMFEDSSYVEAGGLMSYGPVYEEVFRTAAVLVSKILKGAKPADLPIEQPTKFQLVINLKTAKALAIEIPPALLARTDRVIE